MTSCLALGASIIIVLAATGAGMTSARAAGFDCRKASNPVEKLICTDPALSDLDSELKRVYDTVENETFGHDGETGKTIDPNGRDQLRWLRTVRGTCANTACLKRVYGVRIAELQRRYPDIVSVAGEAVAAIAGTYVRKETGDGGGSMVISRLGAGWRITADVGGIPDGAATHPDCRFDVQGTLAGQEYHGTVLPDEGDKPGRMTATRFDFSITDGRIVVLGADPLVLCEDDRVIIDGIYIKKRS